MEVRRQQRKIRRVRSKRLPKKTWLEEAKELQERILARSGRQAVTRQHARYPGNAGGQAPVTREVCVDANVVVKWYAVEELCGRLPVREGVARLYAGCAERLRSRTG